METYGWCSVQRPRLCVRKTNPKMEPFFYFCFFFPFWHLSLCIASSCEGSSLRCVMLCLAWQMVGSSMHPRLLPSLRCKTGHGMAWHGVAWHGMAWKHESCMHACILCMHIMHACYACMHIIRAYNASCV